MITPAMALRLIVVGLIGAALAFTLHWFYSAGYTAGKAELERAVAAAEKRAYEDHVARIEVTGRIDDEVVKKLRTAEKRAAALRAESDGLRQQLAALAASTPGDSAAPGCADVTRQRDRLADLLAESGELLREGQEAGGRLAVTTQGLQSYATEVCRLRVKD